MRGDELELTLTSYIWNSELPLKLPPLITIVTVAHSGTAFAQTSTADHSAHHPAAASAVPAAAALTSDGEVRKVDTEQGKLTLKHGPIANLDMPGMTMVFKVADPKMLDNFKPGDKVKFAVSNKDSAFTVTAIEMAK